MIKLIIFDLDGTLIDAYTAIEKSLKFTLKKLGYSTRISMLRIRRSVGHGDADFVNRFVKAPERKAALNIYRHHHGRALLMHTKPLKGTRDVLAKLKKQGYKLAVASNRPLKFSKILLRHLKLAKYFDFIACAEREYERKPRPTLILRALKRFNVEKEEALYVGDMAIDIKAGNNAGVKAIAVLDGSSSKAELLKQKPFRIMRSPADLLKNLP